MIFLGKIFIFISAFCNRLLGPKVMKLGFLFSFCGLPIVTGCEHGDSLLRIRFPSTLESLALGSGCNFEISDTFRLLGRGELSGVLSISLKCRRFDLTVILRCVVPLRISSALAWLTCSKLCPLTWKRLIRHVFKNPDTYTSIIWSPLFNPTSSAFVFLSTFEIKIPKFLSNPPKIWKFKGSSRLDLAKTTFRSLAFAAQAMLRSRSCPLIFSFSSPCSNVSKKSIMSGSVSKSVKWLLTHNNTTLVTLSRTSGSLNHSRSWLATCSGLEMNVRWVKRKSSTYVGSVSEFSSTSCSIKRSGVARITTWPLRLLLGSIEPRSSVTMTTLPFSSWRRVFSSPWCNILAKIIKTLVIPCVYTPIVSTRYSWSQYLWFSNGK